MTTPQAQVRTNPFAPIYRLQNAGKSREYFENPPAFPLIVDIELTNHCNFHCLMCPTGTGMFRRKTGYLSEDHFLAALDELAAHQTAVRFIRWGEPTLHPHWLKWIGLVKEKGLLCHLTTNGSLLKDRDLDELLDLPLDSIKFSMQGADRQAYLEMRSTDFFQGILEVVKKCHARRADRLLPYLHVSTTVTYESDEMTETFRETFRPYTDLVTTGRTKIEHIDVHKTQLDDDKKAMLLKLKEQESLNKKLAECHEVWHKLSINWDGSVSACCGDYDNLMVLGRLGENSLAEIWRSEKLQFYRRMLVDMRHRELPLCRTCYDPYNIRTKGAQIHLSGPEKQSGTGTSS